jgi:hypothetical protein
LNHGTKHRDSAIMTHSLQIVGTRFSIGAELLLQRKDAER